MKVLNLRVYREKANLSQREIAEMLNTPQSNYWKWEKGKSFPNAEQILQLCEILSCSPNDLFGFKGVHSVVLTRETRE